MRIGLKRSMLNDRILHGDDHISYESVKVRNKLEKKT